VKKARQSHQFYFQEAVKQAQKSGCLRAKTGVVLVKKNQVLIRAFNRIFPDNDFCQKHGCLRDKLKLGLGKEAEKCRSIHAEALAISLAAKKEIGLQDALAYLTYSPCMNCAKLLVAAGIKRVYFLDRHADQTGIVFLEKMGVKCQQNKLVGDNSQKRLRDTQGQR